ncbi:MAG: response regulator [Candidatus Aminicenantes bacterium]|nr:response regulator [Candidatus Aminicenantes bacterium]
MSKTILIIEDNEKHRFLLEDMLDDAGYTVETMTDGNEVNKKMSGEPRFDLIMVDIAVPGFDAIDFILRYRNKYQILVVSAYADGENVREVLPDIKRRIKKPFDTDELLKTVNEILSEELIN